MRHRSRLLSFSIGQVNLTAGKLILSFKPHFDSCLTFYVGTLSSPHNADFIPTVSDNLLAAGSISENLVAISLQPFDSFDGEMTWGLCIYLLNPEPEF